MGTLDRAERSRFGMTESVDYKLNYDPAMDLRLPYRRWIPGRWTPNDCGGSIHGRCRKDDVVWVDRPQCRIAVLLRTRGNKSQSEYRHRSHYWLAVLPNESRLSCGALKKDSFINLRAPSVSSAC